MRADFTYTDIKSSSIWSPREPIYEAQCHLFNPVTLCVSRLTSFLDNQISVSISGETSGLRGVRIMLIRIVMVSLRQVWIRHEHSRQCYSTCQRTNVVFAVGKYDV